MDYVNRKIAIENENLLDLIKQLHDGAFLIPTFQRLFIWNPENIRSFWDSVYQCYPVGSILYWKTDIRLHVHRKVGGFLIPENENNSHTRRYILDGQQRATSLMVSFYGGSGRIREKPDYDFTLYFNLKTRAFFFENEYYRHRWDTDSRLLLRLKDIPDLPVDYARKLNGTSLEIEKNYLQLKYIFTNYSIPMVRLEGYNLESVSSVFEKINQTGVRLGHTDILIARGFKDSAIMVEEDIP